MPNFFDDSSNSEEPFSDRPEEIEGQYNGAGEWVSQEAPVPQIQVQRPANQIPATTAPEPVSAVSSGDGDDGDGDDGEDEDEEISSVLTDARLRLEMGKLYELIMKHELFDGVDADPKAIKSVQKEIRAYAQERMEIMLGMRQEQSKIEATSFPMELFPFNSLEVEVLKALAATATKGESRDAEPLDLSAPPAPVRTTLNPIGGKVKVPTKAAPKVPTKPLQAKPAVPVKRNKAAVEQILREEGLTMEEINAVMDSSGDFLDPEKRKTMTEEEFRKRNATINTRNKRVESENKAPMPTAEQMAHMYSQNSDMARARDKNWDALIGLVQAMPPTKTPNKS